MTEYVVEISRDAQVDIVSIRDYIRDVLLNPTAAMKFLKDTDEAVSSLEVFPYMHMVRPGSLLFGGLEKRQFFYRRDFCLFYVIKEEVKIVRIIKVSYSARDLDAE